MNLAQGNKTLELTQLELKKYLHYDPETGIFTWKIFSNTQVKIGDIAGCLSKKDGYIYIGMKGKLYLAHRLAWLYATGKIPKDMIDHKDGVRNNNRFNNLREANKSQNAQNRIASTNKNKSGYLGVSLHSSNKKYCAYITVDGKCKNLGSFTTPELAHEAYLTAKRQMHDFCTI